MLLLTRTEGQRIFIGDDIAVTVSHLSSKHVQLGIDAPKEVNIVREEVLMGKRSDDSSQEDVGSAVPSAS